MAELIRGKCALPQCSLAMLPVQSAARCIGFDRTVPIQRRLYQSSHIPAIRATSATSEDTSTKKAGKLKKNDNIVFVAGATGQVGSRIVKELLKLGFQVRAGVRNIDKAQTMFAEATTEETNSTTPISKVLSFFGAKKQQEQLLDFVECDLEKPEGIEPALGNAGVVICAIGASEKKILDITGPYRIDYKATENLIISAKNAGVKHFILVTSLGTTKFGWPASVLNLFWGVLIWKAKAEKALTESGLVYTILRPGGMERPTDAFKETHNLRLAPKDALTGGQVSRLQVAELIACIVNNLELGENKILEAIAETTAPLRPIEELLAGIPSDRTTTKKVGTKQNTKPVKQQEEKPVEVKNSQVDILVPKFKELKQQEAMLTAEAENLQKKRKELTEKARDAISAAARANAMANAAMVAAKEGKLLSKEEKERIASSVEAEDSKPPKSYAKQVAKSEKYGKQLDGKPVKPVKSEEPPKEENTEVIEEVPKKPGKFRWFWQQEDADTNTSVSQQTEPKTVNEIDASVSQKDKPVTKETPKSTIPSDTSPLQKVYSESTETTKATSSNTSPLQEDDPETTKETTKPTPSATRPPQKENVEEAKTSRPLSPYNRYSDLKPPSSPMPKAPSAESSTKNTKESNMEDTKTDTESNTDTFSETNTPAFRWPWQKENVKPSQPVKSNSISSAESESTPSIDSDSNGQPAPLSTYSRYTDLKPSASPPPQTPASEVEDDKSSALSKESKTTLNASREPSSPLPASKPLSPYTRYEDLKPPSSPTPSPPKTMEQSSPDSRNKDTKSVTSPTPPKTDTTEYKDTKGPTSPELDTAKQEPRVDKAAQEAQARALDALQKARAATAFKWPWS